MKILEFASSQLTNKYNLFLDSIETGYEFAGAAGFTWLMVPPKGKSTPHKHHEVECLSVIKGQGRIYSGAEEKEIIPGSFIVLEAFDSHSIENIHESEDLVMLSMVVDDLNNIAEEESLRLSEKKYFITSTPPTPNGDLHLGHLAGPYLRADILTKFLRTQGKTSFHLTGQDDHQSYTAYKANTINKSAQDTANYFGEAIEATLQMADIDISYFTKPKEAPGYMDEVAALFKQLYETNKIIIKNAPSLVCEKCHLYLYEVYVKGLCPHCQQQTGGNFCEACGKINDCADLIDPVCAMCESTPSRLMLKRAYLPLNDYAEELATYHAEIGMNSRLKAYCDMLQKEGLPDVPVSHLSNWGVPCPVPELNNQIISVWFEMGLGHLASMKAFLKEKNMDMGEGYDPWQDENTSLIQCFGFDNSFFNCFLFPATFMALDKKIKLAQALILNQFYYLDGLKFSTSRNHLIWGKDFFQKHPTDLIRWYLCYTNPEDYQSNFSESDFQKATTMLVSYLSTWLTELNKLSTHFNHEAPATGLWEEEHIVFYNQLKNVLGRLNYNYSPQTFSLRSAATALLDLVKESLVFMSKHKKPDHSDEFRTSMAINLLTAKIFCLAAYPIMPKLSSMLWQKLGYKTSFASECDLSWLPKGQIVGNLNEVIDSLSKRTQPSLE